MVRGWVVPAGAGAPVMALGVLSVDAAGLGDRVPGLRVLSLVLAAGAAGVWLVLAVLVLAGRGRGARSPAVLTAVAGTAVLGTRAAAAGLAVPAAVLLALAAGLWVVLLPGVLAGLPRPADGGAFLLVVAAEGLAVLAGSLAGPRWLGAAGTALFLAGLLAYPPVLARFDRGQLRRGAGDQWVAGGALAITALAAGTLARAPGTPPGLGVAGLVLWALAAAWYPVLAAAELYCPRPRYDLRRWSTVFPLGMLPAAGLALARADGLGWLRTGSAVLLGVALAVCAVVAVGAVRSLAATAGR